MNKYDFFVLKIKFILIQILLLQYNMEYSELEENAFDTFAFIIITNDNY